MGQQTKSPIRITFRRDGTFEIEAISVLEDLREDASYFRSQAECIDPQQDRLGYKRACRAALLAFFAFAEGSMNAILFELAVADKKTLGLKFFPKMEFIERAVAGGSNNRSLEAGQFGKL